MLSQTPGGKLLHMPKLITPVVFNHNWVQSKGTTNALKHNVPKVHLQLKGIYRTINNVYSILLENEGGKQY